MFNKRTMAIIKRELRERLFSKSFIIMTLLIPVFLFGILGIQTFLIHYSSDSGESLTIISANEQITSNVRNSLTQSEAVKDKNYKINYVTSDSAGLHAELDKAKNDLLNEKLSGLVFIPETALKNKQVDFYSKNPNNMSIFSNIRGPINQALLKIYLVGKPLDDNDLSYIRDGVSFNGFKVSKNSQIEEASDGNTILAILFSFLLYFSLILLGTIMMRSVVQEKNNRIVEVLLSSANSSELMTGKILGTSITGLLQMIIWLSPIFLVISTSWFAIPAKFMVSITWGQLLFVLFNYFVGLITFTGLFATVGAIFDNDQDAQSGMWPIMMLIMIPFFIAISLASNPTSEIARIASMLPFASIIVMPTRLAMADVPLVQLLISIVVTVGTMLAIFPIAGRIYRVGVLITGKKPSWGEVIKWLKYKY